MDRKILTRTRVGRQVRTLYGTGPRRGPLETTTLFVTRVWVNLFLSREPSLSYRETGLLTSSALKLSIYYRVFNDCFGLCVIVRFFEFQLENNQNSVVPFRRPGVRKEDGSPPSQSFSSSSTGDHWSVS